MPSQANWQPKVLNLGGLWTCLQTRPELRAIDSFLDRESRAGRYWYPDPTIILRAFAKVSCDQVRCVIVGIDPYARGQADGLAFSVKKDWRDRVPISLRNIFHAIKCSHDGASPSSTDLTRWASRGVLLLNAALTVPRAANIKWPKGQKRKDARDDHVRHWKPFTCEVVAALAQKDEPLDFLLWGKEDVWAYSSMIHPPHRVFQASHPSTREFLCDGVSSRPSAACTGCDHFSKTKKRINWL